MKNNHYTARADPSGSTRRTPPFLIPNPLTSPPLCTGPSRNGGRTQIWEWTQWPSKSPERPPEGSTLCRVCRQKRRGSGFPTLTVIADDLRAVGHSDHIPIHRATIRPGVAPAEIAALASPGKTTCVAQVVVRNLEVPFAFALPAPKVLVAVHGNTRHGVCSGDGVCGSGNTRHGSGNTRHGSGVSGNTRHETPGTL